MNLPKSSSVIFIVILALGIEACGGGGGGGTPPTPTVITYTGNTAPAHITADNANIFMANILTGPGGPNVISSAAVASTNSSQALPLTDAFRSLATSTRRAVPQATSGWVNTLVAALISSISVDETVDCEAGGTMTFTGELNEDGTGVLNIKFGNCQDSDGITENGKATFQIDAYDPVTDEILDGTLRFTALNMKGSPYDVTLNGSMRDQISLADQRETFTINAVIKDNRSTKLFKWENVVDVETYDDYLNPSRHAETLTGRIYDSVEGYVDVTTASPLTYSNEGLDFPDGGGPLVLTGAEGSKAWLLVPSPSKARIEVDADGDGTFETVAVYLWTNLAGEPAPNEPPAGTVILSPPAPKTSDTLTAAITATDPDGDPLTYTYIWTRNGNPILGATTSTLGADQSAKGDTMAVTVTISDGAASTSATASVTIADSPPTFAAIAPVNAVYGAPVTFQIQASDTDGDLITYALAYGPAGMQIDSVTGEVSWTPSGPMFDETLDVHFGVRATADGVMVETAGTVTVTDPSHARPLVRTGIQIPGRADGLRIADFNGDGKNEILVTDQRDLLYTLVFNGANYVQDWVYPFELSTGYSITAIAAHDLTGDGHPDMIVGAGPRIVILDGVSRKIVGEISDGYSVHYSIHVADIDNDGKEEIVYLGANDTYSSQLTINVYDAGSLQQEWQSPVLDLGESLAVGNVAGDSALEIITAKGCVFDGATHANVWSYGPGFGFLVDTGDLDNDGVEEIVGAVDWQAVRVFSARSKSPLWEIPKGDIDALLVANIDADPQAEILVGDGQWGNVTAYDGSSHAEDWSINSQNYGVSSLAVGDADNDGNLEFVWASGYLSTGADSLVVAGLNPGIGVEWINTSPQLGEPFLGGRWLAQGAGQGRALFSVIFPESSYETRLAMINPATGEMELSAVTGQNNYSYQPVPMDLADYTGDGIEEVGLAFPTNGGYFSVFDLTTNSVIWTSATGLGIGQVIAHGDFNADGKNDLAVLTQSQYTDELYLYLYDVANSVLIWKSPQLPGTRGLDMEITDLDGDGIAEIVVATGAPASGAVPTPTGTLSVYQRVNGSYVLRNTRSLPAAGLGDYWATITLAVGDFDGDGKPEIAVTTKDYNPVGAVVTDIVEILNAETLDSEAQIAMAGPVSDSTVVPGPNGRDNLVLAEYQDISKYFASFTSHLIMMDATSGQEIWRSPEIIGQVQRNSLSFADINGDGIQELIFGTSRAMYLTR